MSVPSHEQDRPKEPRTEPRRRRRWWLRRGQESRDAIWSRALGEAEESLQPEPTPIWRTSLAIHAAVILACVAIGLALIAASTAAQNAASGDWLLLPGLLLVNVPVFLLIGRIVFGGWDGLWDNEHDEISGDYVERRWAANKTILFVIWSAAMMVAEYQVWTWLFR